MKAIKSLLGKMIIVLVTISSQPVHAELNEYLVPAEITKLDWILMQIQVSSFTQKIRWDDFGLVDSVSLFSIGPKVGMTILVNKNSFIRLEDNIMKKVFRDIVETTHGIIKFSLPEIELDKDIIASLITVENGKIVAKFEDGKIRVK